MTGRDEKLVGTLSKCCEQFFKKDFGDSAIFQIEIINRISLEFEISHDSS